MRIVALVLQCRSQRKAEHQLGDAVKQAVEPSAKRRTDAAQTSEFAVAAIERKG